MKENDLEGIRGLNGAIVLKMMMVMIWNAFTHTYNPLLLIHNNPIVKFDFQNSHSYGILNFCIIYMVDIGFGFPYFPYILSKIFTNTIL